MKNSYCKQAHKLGKYRTLNEDMEACVWWPQVSGDVWKDFMSEVAFEINFYLYYPLKEKWELATEIGEVFSLAKAWKCEAG